MASATLVPLETYLHSVYRPDCEYIDGELKERMMGEKDHARLQMTFGWILRNHQEDWGIQVFPELRVQVTPTRFRVPDLTVLRADAPDEQIVTHPPLIVIEILSPEDSLMGMRERVTDYLNFGIANVWLVDPSDRMGYICVAPTFGDWKATTLLAVPGTEIALDLTQLSE